MLPPSCNGIFDKDSQSEERPEARTNGGEWCLFSFFPKTFFGGHLCSSLRDEVASSDTDSTLDHVALLPQSAPVEYCHSDSALHHPGRGGKRKRSATAGIMSPRLLRHPLRNELYWTSSLQQPRPLSWQGWKLCVLGQVDRATLQHFSTLCARYAGTQHSAL